MSVAVAIIGVGRMGRVHAAALTAVNDVEVVMLCDVADAPTRDLADRLGIDHVVNRYSAVLESPHVDAVLLATPTPSHPAMVAKALAAGKHVLCEKPLALDADIGLHLGEDATAAGLVLQVGFWRRFSPPWLTARALVARGAIGTPVLLRLSQWDADPPPAVFCDPAVSGGLAIDCGVHEFDLAEWLTGRRVLSAVGQPLPIVSPEVAAAGDVDNLLAVLRLEGGAVATVDLSRNARYGDDVRTEILGSDGAIFIELLPTGRALLATKSGVEEVAGSAVADATVAGVRGQAEAFARAVATGSVDYPGSLASARAVRIGDAVNHSVLVERPVEIAADL